MTEPSSASQTPSYVVVVLMAGVGCSGEVKINRVGDDYAAWGINILVSYRDNDALQLLTGSLQSGGVSQVCHWQTHG